MDVGGARLNSALENEVDQTDDRGLGGQIAQVFHIFFIGIGPFAGQAFGNLAHGRLAATEVALDGVVDFRGDAHPWNHLTARRHLERLEGKAILGVGHDHLDAGLIDPDRHQVLLLHVAQGNVLDGRRLFGIVLVANQGNAKQLGLGAGQVPL